MCLIGQAVGSAIGGVLFTRDLVKLRKNRPREGHRQDFRRVLF